MIRRRAIARRLIILCILGFVPFVSFKFEMRYLGYSYICYNEYKRLKEEAACYSVLLVTRSKEKLPIYITI